MNREIMQLRNKARDTFINIFAIASYGVEVILRYGFGERYFNVIMFFGTILTIYFWSGIFDVFGALSDFVTSMITSNGFWEDNTSVNSTPDISYRIRDGYVFLVAVLGLWHIAAIQSRNARGIRWHTRNSGISHLTRFIPNDRLVKLIIEPLLVLVVGFFLTNWRTIDPSTGVTYIYATKSLGLYLTTAGILLFSKEYLLDRELRERYLNALDSQIESKFFRKLMDQGWNEFFGTKWPLPKDIQGFVVRMPVQPKTESQFVEFQEAIAGLDLNLQKLYNKKKWDEEAKDKGNDNTEDDMPEDEDTPE